GPRAQCAPIVRLARLTAIDQADDALGQAGAIVRLDASWHDGGVAPSSRQQLFGRGGIIIRTAELGKTVCRHGRVGCPWHSVTAESAKHHKNRDTVLGLGRGHQSHADVHADGRTIGVVDMSDEAFTVSRQLADETIGNIRDYAPRHFGDVLWYTPDHLAFEVLDNLGATQFPPRLSCGDLLSVFESEGVG